MGLLGTSFLLPQYLPELIPDDVPDLLRTGNLAVAHWYHLRLGIRKAPRIFAREAVHYALLLL